MQRSDVCAVVVTYHPGPGFEQGLRQMRQQLGGLVVVDNGSTDGELAALHALLGSGELAAGLILHGENLGIATALNAGVRWAAEQGFAMVLLLDQDSDLTEGFVDHMTACFARSPWGQRLGILTPRYTDSRLHVPIPANPATEGKVREGLEAAMTSGSLLRTGTFTALGPFVDALFIDGVDYEYSLRLRAAGLVIDECPQAELMHSPGEPRVIRFRGRRLYQTANYSPLRRYYQERNKIWITRRYWRQFPVFCARLFLFSTKDFIKILVAEQGSARKARYFLRGAWDGIREKMGRLDQHRLDRSGSA